MARSKKAIDLIVATATGGQYTGDKRDGKAPPITLENFALERSRYGAKALRARLSRLSLTELEAELSAAAAYVKTTPPPTSIEELVKASVRYRQSELGRRPLWWQEPIEAAARHYRPPKTAKAAWDAIAKEPYEAEKGETVFIKGDKPEDMMYVRSRDGRQISRPIGFEQWRQRYWPPAKRRVSAEPG
jgi:hypothetical protein